MTCSCLRRRGRAVLGSSAIQKQGAMRLAQLLQWGRKENAACGPQFVQTAGYGEPGFDADIAGENFAVISNRPYCVYGPFFVEAD
jgi:hypothetical protein